MINKKLSAKQTELIMTILGILLTGTGNGILRWIAWGTDPYSCMNIGLSNAVPFSFGTTQLFVNLMLLALQVGLLRKSIGIGTVINLVCMGYLSDGVLYVVRLLNLPELLPLKVVLLAATIVLLGFAIALYSTADMGIAPYDSVAVILAARTRRSYRACRMLTDVFCVGIGFAFGSAVGVATLAAALGTGPFVQLFSKRLTRKILAGA